MSVKTIAKLVAKIGFDVDLSGLTKFNSAIKSSLGTLKNLNLGILASGIALAKFIEKQGQSATKSQVQSAYYDIQQKQLLGLSSAYKAIGANIGTHLAALKQFQDIQGNLLVGKINTQAIQALAVSGSSSLVNTMFYGKQSDFEKAVTQRYDFLRAQHTNYTDKQANQLRQQFGSQINDEHQKQILIRSSGLSYQQAIDKANLLKYGATSTNKIEDVQYQLQSFAYKVGMIGTALEGIFIRIGIGFTKAFSAQDLKKFTDALVAFGPTAINIGEGIGDVFKGVAAVFETILSVFDDLSDAIGTNGPIMKDTLIGIGVFMAALVPAGIILRIALMAKTIYGLIRALIGLKAARGAARASIAGADIGAAESAGVGASASAGIGAAEESVAGASAIGAGVGAIAPLAIGAMAGIAIGNAITHKHKVIHHYVQNNSNPLISLNAQDSYANREQLIKTHNHTNNIHVHIGGSNVNAHEIGSAIAHHLGMAYNASDNQRAN